MIWRPLLLFLPVESKRIEMVTPEVKHGIYLILYAFTQDNLVHLGKQYEKHSIRGKDNGRYHGIFLQGRYLPFTQGFRAFTPL